MKELIFKEGDILGEISHYKVTRLGFGSVHMTHLGSGQGISIQGDYLKKYCTSADFVSTNKKVSGEDSASGKGIRTIFESIPAGSVFTVVFRKQPKKLSQKAQIASIEKVLKDVDFKQHSPKDIASLLVKEGYTTSEGELRTLRGYKLTNYTRDGKYECMDADLGEVRPVNINTIESLIWEGINYIIK